MTIPVNSTPETSDTPLSTTQYRKQRRKNKHPFNFELDAQRREQLRQIADHRAISMGATLRQLVSTAYLMDLRQSPHCVDGRACYMPHLHVQASSPPTPEHTPT